MPMRNKGLRSAVIDIGSNSVRLVVYAGHKRIASIIFNEKVLAGLGSELSTTGNIGEENFEIALHALRRFKLLCDEFRVDNIYVIATAAVRDAHNGPLFVQEAQKIGLEIQIIEGQQEAQYSASGVMSAFPKQNGIMADLGGGSLEIAQIEDNKIIQKISIPMGVLRVRQLFEKGYEALNAQFLQFIKQSDWTAVKSVEALFLVGGSWRALAHIDMNDMDYPLRVVDQYQIDLKRALNMNNILRNLDNVDFNENLNISLSRIDTLPQAAGLMRCVTEYFNPAKILVSASGLREGILYSQLSEVEKRLDPLLVATDEFALTQRRFHGQRCDLDAWISPIFTDDRKAMLRIRQAFCNLGDVAWRANPDFRAEWGLEIGLHGSWTAISGAERDILGQALFSSFGGGPIIYPGGGKLAANEDMNRAIAWGLAVRLAQRLSGGRTSTLSYAHIKWDEDMIILEIDSKYRDIGGEKVEKRLRQLALFLNYEYKIIEK